MLAVAKSVYEVIELGPLVQVPDHQRSLRIFRGLLSGEAFTLRTKLA